MKFKIGDKVKCIDDTEMSHHIQNGKIYIIKQITQAYGVETLWIKAKEQFLNDGFYSRRFIKVTNPIDIINKAILEAKNG